MTWQTLGGVDPARVIDARLQLHHAAQVVASAGLTYLEPQPDDSHPNFAWAESFGALLGRRLPNAGVQIGLRFEDFALILVDVGGQLREVFALDGKTLDGAYSWLEAVTVRAGAKLPASGLTRSRYELTHHAVETGAPFSAAPPAAFSELACWFANADSALTELAERTPGASEVRCWPHHFDLGALAVLASHGDGSLAKSIGFGLSPGDQNYAEPYWYVSPWPYPDSSALPALEPIGIWHTKGFTSAILESSALLAGPAEGQRERLFAFLDASVTACQHLLAN